jgi:hypothetical protein
MSNKILDNMRDVEGEKKIETLFKVNRSDAQLEVARVVFLSRLGRGREKLPLT